MAEKVLSFGIPCYNSAGYMDHCIQSILDASDGADDVQIVIVDDGSTKDETPQKADEWARRLPETVKAVHQANGGHGAAVMTGLEYADGMYYKVVDSDDWVDAASLRALLDDIRSQKDAAEPVDLFVTNYVYEHVSDNTSHSVGYASVLPEGRPVRWDDVAKFRLDQNLLMHALTFRTDVLRDGGVPLPRHTFYVDNIYAWVPLPRVRTLFYRNVDLYRYYIGREDQSVNEKVMANRYDQQIRITRIMVDAYHLDADVKSERLRSYMYNYLAMMMAISTIFGHMSDDPASDKAVDDLWRHLEEHDAAMYGKIRHRHPLGILTNLPGSVGRKITTGGYRIARRIFKFN